MPGQAACAYYLDNLKLSKANKGSMMVKVTVLDSMLPSIINITKSWQIPDMLCTYILKSMESKVVMAVLFVVILQFS